MQNTLSLPKPFQEMTFGDLYQRQDTLQQIGTAQGHKKYKFIQLVYAYLDEIHEVSHAIKPLWTWWGKPGLSKQVIPQEVLGEIADGLHFSLIYDLRMKNTGIFWDQLLSSYATDTFKLNTPDEVLEFYYSVFLRSRSIHQTIKSAPDYLQSMMPVLSYFGFTMEDLIRAYFAKNEENIQRWKDSQTQRDIL